MSQLPNANCRWQILSEILVWLISWTIAALLMRSLLFEGTTTLAHDNYYWGLPIFRFFAQNMAEGHFPLWNPYSHGGEPLYPALLHLRLLEPIPRLMAWILPSLYSTNAILLFNWYKVCESWFLLFGIYLWLRIYCRSLWIRLSLVPLLTFSSLFLGGLRQDGILNQTLWLPYLILALDRIFFHELNPPSRWLFWLLAALAIGISWQSYFFTGTWLFLVIYFAFLASFARQNFIPFIQEIRANVWHLTAFSLIVVGMLGPNLITYWATKNLVHVVRMDDGNAEGRSQSADRYDEEGEPKHAKSSIARMPYAELVRNGNFLNPWNILQVTSGSSNPHILKNSDLTWGKPSEAYLYLGLIPWLLAVYGMFFGVSKTKNIWLGVLAFYVLLCLGPAAGLHPIAYGTIPILWPLRQLHCLIGVIGIAFLYFYVLGANKIDEELEKI